MGVCRGVPVDLLGDAVSGRGSEVQRCKRCLPDLPNLVTGVGPAYQGMRRYGKGFRGGQWCRSIAPGRYLVQSMRANPITTRSSAI